MYDPPRSHSMYQVRLLQPICSSSAPSVHAKYSKKGLTPKLRAPTHSLLDRGMEVSERELQGVLKLVSGLYV